MWCGIGTGWILQISAQRKECAEILTPLSRSISGPHYTTSSIVGGATSLLHSFLSFPLYPTPIPTFPTLYLTPHPSQSGVPSSERRRTVNEREKHFRYRRDIETWKNYAETWIPNESTTVDGIGYSKWLLLLATCCANLWWVSWRFFHEGRYVNLKKIFSISFGERKFFFSHQNIR